MNTRFTSGVLAMIAAVSGFASVASAGNVTLKPGRYEVTVTYEVQHERQNQSQTAIRCIRALDLESPERVFNDRTDAAPRAEEICKVKDFKNAAGKVSYNADCSNRTVHVEGNVNETAFRVVRTVRPKASAGVSLKFTVSGKWLEDCDRTGTDGLGGILCAFD